MSWIVSIGFSESRLSRSKSLTLFGTAWLIPLPEREIVGINIIHCRRAPCLDEILEPINCIVSINLNRKWCRLTVDDAEKGKGSGHYLGH